MQVSVESTGELGRKLKITVPAERVEQEFQGRLARLAKQVKLDGFRKGKVPMKVVEARYGEQVMGEIATDLIQSTYREAVGQEGLAPAGGPKIDGGTPERGKEFEYTASFEIYPAVKETTLGGDKLLKPVYEISEADVAHTLESIRKQRTVWSIVEREAKMGDQLVIDFLGKIDNEPFAGGKAEDFALELGSGSFIPGFEEGLVGIKAGDEIKLPVKFPGDYHAEQLAGKDAVFEVKVKAVNEGRLPEVDAEFIAGLGVKADDAEGLNKQIRENLEREAGQRSRSLLNKRVFDAIVARNPLEVPEALVNDELLRMGQMRAAQLGQQTGQKLDPKNFIAEADIPAAKRQVTIGLIFSALMEKEKLEVDEARVKARIEDMAGEYEDTDAFVRWFYSEPARLREVEGLVLEELIVAKLLEGATIEEEKMDFQTLVKTTSARA